MKVNRQVSSLGLGSRTAISLLEKQPSESKRYGWVWWCMPVRPTNERQRQEDCCKLQTSLDYIMSSRLVWDAG